MKALSWMGWVFICCILTPGAAAFAQEVNFAAPIEAVYDLPHLSGIAIDGRSEDWGEGGFRVEVLSNLSPAGAALPDAEDFTPTFRLAWDWRGLLVLATVRDDRGVESDDLVRLYLNDALDLFVAEHRGGENYWQLLIAPGADPRHPQPRWHINDPRDAALRPVAMNAEVAAVAQDGGYTIEALLPWSNLKIEPTPGRELAFQAYAYDNDGAGRRVLGWLPRLGAHADSSAMQRVRLAAAAAAPVRLTASARFEHLSRGVVELSATADLAGAIVTLRGGKGALAASATLEPVGGLARARLVVPMPPPGCSYGPLELLLDGHVFAKVELPDADRLRQAAFARAELDVQPVFAGTTLPAVDFKVPGWVDYLVGGYAIRTTYYDADFNEVTRAECPGRYGAVVEVTPTRGRPQTRYLTLYRQRERLDWWWLRWQGVEIELPAQLGVDPRVCRVQGDAMGEGLKRALQDACARRSDIAAWLAWLVETSPQAPPAGSVDGPDAADRRWWHALKSRLGRVEPLNYGLHLPHEYEDDGEKRWPLVLFLHGAGERGDNLELVARHGPARLIREGHDLPFICVWPQCPRNSWWPDEVWRLSDLLNAVQADYRVDADRVYVTGLSMGGFGTWSMAASFPGRFAAAGPICGGGDPRDARLIGQLPIWVFHGAKDGVVPLGRSREMVEALRAAGGNAVFTVYPEAGHDAWTATYADPRFWQWLLSNRRGQAARMPADTSPAAQESP